MRKIFGAYRFHLLYDRLAGGFRNPDLGASLDYEIFSRIAVVELKFLAWSSLLWNTVILFTRGIIFL